MLLLLLPALLGPGLSLARLLCRGGRLPGQDWVLILSITIIFLVFYSLNLVLAEFLFDYLSLFHFVLLKHVISNFSSVLIPVAAIIQCGRLRREIRKVYRSKSSVQANDEDMTLQQIRRHVLASAGEA